MCFPKKLKDENMIMATLTILRFLDGILRKEFHKVQDAVKKKISSWKLSAVKTLPHRFQVKVNDVFSSYVSRYLVGKRFMHFVWLEFG